MARRFVGWVADQQPAEPLADPVVPEPVIVPGIVEPGSVELATLFSPVWLGLMVVLSLEIVAELPVVAPTAAEPQGWPFAPMRPVVVLLTEPDSPVPDGL